MDIKELVLEIKSQVSNFTSNIDTPWELLSAMKNHHWLASSHDDDYPGVHILPNSVLIVGKNCTIQPSVVINGVVVLGDNVFIGAHSLLRGHVFIGNDSVIGSYNELSSSFVGSRTKISHRNDILNSVIGKNCWLTSNVSIHNVRLDLGDVKVTWQGKETYVERSFGCIIEDDVTIGVWAKIMPGTVISKNNNILGPCLISPNKIRKFKTVKSDLNL